MDCLLENATKCLMGSLIEGLRNVFNDVKNYEDTVDSLKEQMHQLQNKRDAIEDKLKADGLKGRKPIKEVEEWVAVVKELESETRRIELELDKSNGCLCDCSTYVCKAYKFSKLANKKLEHAKKLIESGNFSEVSKERNPRYIVERPAGLLVGMETTLEQLKNYINDENVSVIGILGMGRVGKSTILKTFCSELNPEERTQIYFDVGHQLNVDEMQKRIVQQFELEWQESVPSDERAGYIRTRLKEREFLLILDNVWKYVDLASLGIPDLMENKKSKAILSTRFTEVCNEMSAKIVRVQGLSFEDSWTLFKEKAGDEAQRLMNDSRIREQGEELVKKCDGLPEALINLGFAVASLESQEQWRFVVEELDTNPWKIHNMEKVLSSLKESYDKLDDTLQKCLLYCSLYPEGFSIEKEWIINYCIGEGLIDEYAEGDMIMAILKAVSLLETGTEEDQIKMHAMVRAMALWIARESGKNTNGWLVHPKHNLREVPNPSLWEGAQRVSLMRNKIASLPQIPNCPELETLLLQDNRQLNKIPDDFFKFMPVLKVLDISQTAIENLPPGIGSLVNLQYLNVCDTKTKSLPKNLRKLVKLRFLLLSRTPIETIPEGVIANLTELQSLYIDFSYGNWRVGKGSTGVNTVFHKTGVNIEEFNELNKLKALGMTVERFNVLENVAKTHSLAERMRHLQIRGCDGMTSISTKLLGEDLKGVLNLEVKDVNDLKELVIGGDEWYLQNVSNLQLNGLSNMKIVWNQGWFKNLSELSVARCDEMEILVHWDGELSEKEAIEEGQEQEYENGNKDDGSVVADEEEKEAAKGEKDIEKIKEIGAFPHLRTLELSDMPKLRTLCEGRRLALPSLEHLQVINCPKLKKLSIGANKLQLISGEQVWWSIVEKDDSYKKVQFKTLSS
ncbi:disease resistance protein RPS2-like [Canna indica]|uniref:Disease resistance protein RPS2-like n=1 Tax=Canna indica TaxID=4628 RepID=A0AAQ3L0N7_9LILI|nr:disease resistance protein RPS2-like [Canna indica]